TSAMAVGGNFGARKETSWQSAARSPRIFDTAGDPRLSPAMTQEQVRTAVEEWLRQKPDFARMPTYDSRWARIYPWAVEEIHRGGLMTFGHTENAPASVQAGQDVVEHIWGYLIPGMSPQEHEDFQKGKHLHWASFIRDWPRLEQLIRDAVERGAYLNPTLQYELGSLSALASRHEEEAYQVYRDPFLMAYFPRNIAESLLQKQRQIRSFSGKYENLVLLSRVTSEEVQEYRRGYRLVGEFLKRYVDAGGKIQAGTDTASGGTPGLGLHHEMEMLVELGLTPAQALQSATSWAAAILTGRKRGEPEVGLIRAGAFADLVVLSANPLDQIVNTKKIERVMKGGKWIEPGYDPAYFTFTRPPRKIAMATATPELSALSPYTVLEGTPAFDLIVRGVGFIGNSVVRVDGVSVPTTFVNPRTLRARIPANVIERATPNQFMAPGPEQMVGVFGDRTVSISVFTPPPEGGASNSISLRVRAKWMGVEEEE
ncbi:MAG: amidohydrolase family protein, partial [Terriglobia bacterium]